jgi:hypothetical protein
VRRSLFFIGSHLENSHRVSRCEQICARPIHECYRQINAENVLYAGALPVAVPALAQARDVYA